MAVATSKLLYHCALSLNLHLSRGKFSKIIPKCFLQVFEDFKYYVSKNIVFLMNVVIFQPIEPRSLRLLESCFLPSSCTAFSQAFAVS